VATSAEAGIRAGAELEEAACLFCPRGTATEQRFSDPPFAVVRCTGCGLVFVSPRVAAHRVTDLYGAQYWLSPSAKDYGYTDYRADAARWRRTYEVRARVLDGRIAAPGRVLDVGCAAGYFLGVMRARGWDAWGIEVSAPIAAEARAALGDEHVHVGSLSDAPYERSSFDLITFWDVVEHLPDPVAALRQARELLAPGGLLLVETQDVGSAFARLMGRRWQHFKQAEHLWHFSRSTLPLLLERGGWSAELLTARRAGKYVSLDFVVERAGRVHPALSRALAPLRRAGELSAYVNLRDELIALARPG